MVRLIKIYSCFYVHRTHTQLTISCNTNIECHIECACVYVYVCWKAKISTDKLCVHCAQCAIAWATSHRTPKSRTNIIRSLHSFWGAYLGRSSCRQCAAACICCFRWNPIIKLLCSLLWNLFSEIIWCRWPSMIELNIYIYFERVISSGGCWLSPSSSQWMCLCR